MSSYNKTKLMLRGIRVIETKYYDQHEWNDQNHHAIVQSQQQLNWYIYFATTSHRRQLFKLFSKYSFKITGDSRINIRFMHDSMQDHHILVVK